MLKPYVFWSETGAGRDLLLRAMFHAMKGSGWRYTTDPGWEQWDILIYSKGWNATLATVTDDHGRGKCLTRVRARLRPNYASIILLALLVVYLIWSVGIAIFGRPPNVPSWLRQNQLNFCALLCLFALIDTYRTTRHYIRALVTAAAKDDTLVVHP